MVKVSMRDEMPESRGATAGDKWRDSRAAEQRGRPWRPSTALTAQGGVILYSVDLMFLNVLFNA